MARIIELTRRYQESLQRIGVVMPSQRGRAIAKAIGRLSSSDVLPTLEDGLTAIPPTGFLHFRRVDGTTWLLFSFDETTVRILRVMDQPPVPVD